MFDVGFWELLLIFGMGLMILGPERMPRVAAQVGLWIGRARKTANQFRRKLQREFEMEDWAHDGIAPQHRPAARPQTTTRTGNTPTAVPTSAKAANAATGWESSPDASTDADAEPDMAEPASADAVEPRQREQPGGHLHPTPSPSPAPTQADEAPETSEAPGAQSP